MTDIKQRLRARAFRLATRDMNGDGACLAKEAADRITDLEGALKSAYRKLTDYCDNCEIQDDIAAALFPDGVTAEIDK